MCVHVQVCVCECVCVHMCECMCMIFHAATTKTTVNWILLISESGIHRSVSIVTAVCVIPTHQREPVFHKVRRFTVSVFCFRCCFFMAGIRRSLTRHCLVWLHSSFLGRASDFVSVVSVSPQAVPNFCTVTALASSLPVSLLPVCQTPRRRADMQGERVCPCNCVETASSQNDGLLSNEAPSCNHDWR